MLKIGVLVSGSGTNLQNIIDSINSGYMDAEIVFVVSGRKSAYALERAKANGIPSAFISRKRCSSDEEYGNLLIDVFSRNKAELIVTAGFLSMLPRNFVQKYEFKIINIHPSLIPSFCGKGFYGLAVHDAVLKSGVKITGATVHFVDAEYDTGPIILQRAVDVLYKDTPEILQKRVMEQAEKLILPETIKLISENRIVIEDGRAYVKDWR